MSYLLLFLLLSGPLGSAENGLTELEHLPSPRAILYSVETGDGLERVIAETNRLLRDFLARPIKEQRSSLQEFLTKSLSSARQHKNEENEDRTWDIAKLDLITVSEDRGSGSLVYLRAADILPGVRVHPGRYPPTTGFGGGIRTVADPDSIAMFRKAVNVGHFDWPGATQVQKMTKYEALVAKGVDVLVDLLQPSEIAEGILYNPDASKLVMDTTNKLIAEFWQLPEAVERAAFLRYLAVCAQRPISPTDYDGEDFDASKLDLFALAKGLPTKLVGARLFFLGIVPNTNLLEAREGLHPTNTGPVAYRAGLDSSGLALARRLVEEGYFDRPSECEGKAGGSG